MWRGGSLLLLPITLLIAVLSSACERVVTVTAPGTVDTVFVPKVDTLRLTTIDTVTRVDTVTRTVTVAGPPVHDSVVVVRVDTVTKVDTVTQTITLPGTVVHDTTWVYTQTNPTNPFAGGDVDAGVAYLPISDGYGIVFWHGHFVGTVHVNNDGTWRAWLYVPGQMVMPLRGDFPTLEEAVTALIPQSIVLTVSH